MVYPKVVTFLLLVVGFLAITDALKCFDCQGGSRSSCARKPSKTGGQYCRRGQDVCIKGKLSLWIGKLKYRNSVTFLHCNFRDLWERICMVPAWLQYLRRAKRILLGGSWKQQMWYLYWGQRIVHRQESGSMRLFLFLLQLTVDLLKNYKLLCDMYEFIFLHRSKPIFVDFY